MTTSPKERELRQMPELSTTSPETPRDNNPLNDVKLLCVLCHASALIGLGIILPLIVYCIKKEECETVAAHAKEALNFHLTMMIYGFISALLTFVLIGIPMMIAVIFGSLIFAIIGTIKAADDEVYRYPLTIRLI